MLIVVNLAQLFRGKGKDLLYKGKDLLLLPTHCNCWVKPDSFTMKQQRLVKTATRRRGSPIGFAGCGIAIILVTGNGMFVKIASRIRDY